MNLDLHWGDTFVILYAECARIWRILEVGITVGDHGSGDSRENLNLVIEEMERIQI